MARKYVTPDFVVEQVPEDVYRKWLDRKAAAHYKRDRNRGSSTARRAQYKEAIHAAVLNSDGRDAYTNEELHWGLIGQYDNYSAKAGGRIYKWQFALLPTVDHVGDGSGPADFRICGWAVNDAKNELSLTQFLELCKRVPQYARRHT